MKIPIALTVNKEGREVEVLPHHTLLSVLRDQLNLTGSKECCSLGECGSCTVLMNGRAVCSCLVLAAEADGNEITTIEGLCGHKGLDALQTAFVEQGAVQCGFCIPGMIMSSVALLEKNPQPTQEDIEYALDGNICRCAGYRA